MSDHVFVVNNVNSCASKVKVAATYLHTWSNIYIYTPLPQRLSEATHIYLASLLQRVYNALLQGFYALLQGVYALPQSLCPSSGCLCSSSELMPFFRAFMLFFRAYAFFRAFMLFFRAYALLQGVCLCPSSGLLMCSSSELMSHEQTSSTVGCVLYERQMGLSHRNTLAQNIALSAIPLSHSLEDGAC